VERIHPITWIGQNRYLLDLANRRLELPVFERRHENLLAAAEYS